MYQRILVPTDGSDISSVAVDAAIAFARICGSENVALSIAQPEPVLPTAEGALGTGGESRGPPAKRLARTGKAVEPATQAGCASACRI